MDQNKFKTLCSQYFFNTIDDSGLDELKSAIKSGDTQLLKIFYETKRAIDNLPISLDLIEPPNEVKKNILNELKKGKYIKNDKSQSKYQYQINRVKKKFVSAVAVILFISLIIIIFYSAALQREIKSLDTQIMQLNNTLSKKNEILNILQSKQIEIINLHGQDINPSGYGKIIWSPENNAAVLQIGNLPPTTGKEKYQLWTIENNSPVNQGSFSIQKPDYENFFKLAHLSSKDINNNFSFLLTLQPEGEASTPTGTIYLMSGNDN